MNDANPVTDTLAKVVPPKYQGIFLLLVAIHPYLTRAAYAWRNNGGLKNAICSIWLGTNTPKPAAPVDSTATVSKP